MDAIELETNYIFDNFTEVESQVLFYLYIKN